MSDSEREHPTQDPDAVLDPDYNVAQERWLSEAPKRGAGELADEDVKVPIESSFVKKMRDEPRGPYIVAPDSADWAPPDLLAVPDPLDVEKVARRRNAQLAREGTLSSQVKLPAAQERFLDKQGHEAAKMLLKALDRGLEASSSELDKAVLKRARKRHH